MRCEWRRASGFSLLELLVVCAIVAIAAGIAVPAVLVTMRVSAYKSTIAFAVNRLAMRRAEAARGSSQSFSVVSDLVLEHASMVVNPPDVPPPDRVEVASAVTFQGGTGNCYVLGEHRPAAIVIANRDDPDEAYAIVVGGTSGISTKRKTARGWEDFVQ